MGSQDAPPDNADVRAPITVVIADDHPITREGTRQILEGDSGIRVVGEAADGMELLTLVERMTPDVAMVDISMPRMNGIEATKRVKALRPAIAVLIVSAYDDDRYVFAALAAGAAGYLLKDASARTLTRAVHQVHAGEPVLHPEIAKKVLARVAESHEAFGSNSHDSDLTDRERQTLRLAARGMSNAAIARSLSVSIRTVQAHLTQTFGKLGVGSRTEAVIAGLRSGLLTMEDLDDD
jgi:DNA-binding NarL/FixJ family response regulator